MKLFVAVLQELIQELKDELGEDETIHLVKMMVKKSGMDIRITDKGTVASAKGITNEDNYLHVFTNLREYLNKKLGIKKTKSLFMKASKQVISLI